MRMRQDELEQGVIGLGGGGHGPETADVTERQVKSQRLSWTGVIGT